MQHVNVIWYGFLPFYNITINSERLLRATKRGKFSRAAMRCNKLRRNPSGNWVILIFSRQKPCTRIMHQSIPPAPSLPPPPLLTPAMFGCFWRTKIVCLTSFKDQFNPRKWKKSLKVQDFKVVNSAICANFTLCQSAKIWPPRAEVIFVPKKFILKYFQKLMRFQLLLD